MTDYRRICVRSLTVLGGTAMIAAAGAAVTGSVADAAPTHAAPSCLARQIHVTRGMSQGGVGHEGFPLVFRNVSHRTCTITGYPGLDAIAKHGRVLAHAKRTTEGYLAGASVRRITVKPRHTASAFVEWVDMARGGKQCRSSAAVEVTVANTFRSKRLPYSVDVCDLQVHPTVAGTTGIAPKPTAYARARHAWIEGAKVSSARQDLFLDRSATHLAHAKRNFSTQVRELHELAALPETSLTKRQIREAHRLVRALDHFFHTPKLYT